MLRDEGRSDFAALITKRGGAQASLVAFDLLRLEGDDLRQWPIEAHREVMRLVAEGAVVFAKVCELGLEGVSKRAGRAADQRPRGRGARLGKSPIPIHAPLRKCLDPSG